MHVLLQCGASKCAGRAALLAVLIGGALLTMSSHAEDSTYVYAVQIRAVVQASPPQITLNWQPDPYGISSYLIYRKAKSDGFWGSGMVLPGSTTNFVDQNVTVGNTYEYQIVKNAARGYTGYGYIYSGINAPLTENRGKLVLIVESNATAPLAFELGRLQSDLVGDGWQVIRHDVSSNQSPTSVKNLIVADYQADPANVQATLLFGHVPILYSTN